MADQPDPPEKWRVYEGDPTPDPEPADPSATPHVPYGQPQSYHPVVITTSTSSGAGPKLIILMVAIAVLGAAVAGAIAIFSAVGGPGGLGGIDAKDPDDFATFVDELEDERGDTEVFWVGLYSNYIIADVPYTDDPGDDRELSLTWRGSFDDDPRKGTSTDAVFDLAEIDPDVIDGICDPVLDLAEGATRDNCYVFISKPDTPDGAWFYTSAQDEFTRSFSIQYDKNGNEVSRSVP